MLFGYVGGGNHSVHTVRATVRDSKGAMVLDRMGRVPLTLKATNGDGCSGQYEATVDFSARRS